MTPDDKKEFWACLALRHTRGIGPRTRKKLLGVYGSAYAAVSDVRDWDRRGVASRTQARAVNSEAWREEAAREWEAVKARDAAILFWRDEQYPERLREIPDSPLFLYVEGSVPLLSNSGVAVVGSRKCTSYGREATRDIAEGLSRSGITIISGLAYGIDRQAHMSGLRGPGGSVAVLGAGLDVEYPSGNTDVRAMLRDEGALVTEYGPGTQPDPKHFPVRNRIISGLAMGVVVVEAAKRSGSLITARLGLECGREVFAVPGPIKSESYAGCHKLINEGAKLVGTADEILEELAPQLKGRGKVSPRVESDTAGLAQSPSASSAEPDIKLSQEEARLMRLLQDQDRVHIDSLARRLEWDISMVSRILLELELRGLVRQGAGMTYSAA